MNEISLEFLFSTLALLIISSAFFSGSETAMMSLNRYRLRHLAKEQHKGAIRASKLLENPDRLIGVILIGNNFVNILASSIATIIALRLWGEAGILVATLLLTVVILIFAEVTPKTIAAMHPGKICVSVQPCAALAAACAVSARMAGKCRIQGPAASAGTKPYARQ